jgi:hypothetical protein
MLKLVIVPDLTPMPPMDGAIAPCAVFEFVGAEIPDGAAFTGIVFTLLSTEAAAPSAVVTTTRMAWVPGAADILANTADLVCFGSNGPRVRTWLFVPSTNSWACTACMGAFDELATCIERGGICPAAAELASVGPK